MQRQGFRGRGPGFWRLLGFAGQRFWRGPRLWGRGGTKPGFQGRGQGVARPGQWFQKRPGMGTGFGSQGFWGPGPRFWSRGDLRSGFGDLGQRPQTRLGSGFGERESPDWDPNYGERSDGDWGDIERSEEAELSYQDAEEAYY